MYTILFVDDDKFQHQVFREILEGDGYKVISASGGEEALKVAEKIIPDLILLDIVMPRVGGIETCKVMRSFEYLNLVPVVMLTAMDSDDYLVDALDAGADDYIVKTSAPKVICARLRAHLRMKSLHEEVERLRKDQHIITDAYLEVSSNASLRNALQRITEKISLQIGGRVSVVKISGDLGAGTVIATSDGKTGENIEIDLEKYPELRYAIKNKRPLVIKDVQEDIVVRDVVDTLKDLEVSSLMVIPLPFVQEVDEMGILLLRARGRFKSYDEDDTRLCRAIADAVAKAIKGEKVPADNDINV